MSKDTKIYYFRENLIESILSDLFSLGLVILLVVLNKMYLGDKWYFDIFTLFLFFIKATRGTTVKTFSNMEEFKNYVKEL